MAEIGDKRPAQFTIPGAKRIVAATRWVESQPRNNIPGSQGGIRTVRQVYDAKITAVTAINGAIRAKYTIEVGHWDMSSSPETGGTWVADFTAYAFSSAEDKNTFTGGTGTIGTGNTSVSQSDGQLGSSGCNLLFLPVGGYVCVMFRGYDTSSTPPTAYFTIINMVNSAE